MGRHSSGRPFSRVGFATFKSRKRGTVRLVAARDTAVQFRYPAGEARIFRLTRHSVHKQAPRRRELPVANVAVGPMVEEVCSLDRREGRAEARMKSVGPAPMASDRRDSDLIGSHWRHDPGRAGQSAQSRKIIFTAGLDQR